jgi:RimJ/RimL family protein N-acetyltransferase
MLASMSVSAVLTAPPIDAPENVLMDGVITLSPATAADALTVMEWDADREVQHWYDWPLTPPVDDPETYATRLASAQRTAQRFPESWADGSQLTFIIRSAQTGEGLGWLDLQPRGGGRGNVSYGVVERHRLRGAASRAVALATRYAFDVVGLDRMDLTMIAENAGSRGVALKAGYRQEGVLRSYGVWERYQPELGRRHDWAIFGRLRSD